MSQDVFMTTSVIEVSEGVIAFNGLFIVRYGLCFDKWHFIGSADCNLVRRIHWNEGDKWSLAERIFVFATHKTTCASGVIRHPRPQGMRRIWGYRDVEHRSSPSVRLREVDSTNPITKKAPQIIFFSPTRVAIRK